VLFAFEWQRWDVPRLHYFMWAVCTDYNLHELLSETDDGLSDIHFDVELWHYSLLCKLTEFYDNCIGPEIVNLVSNLGLPIRNLKTKQ